MSETTKNQFFNITIKDGGEHLSVKLKSDCYEENLTEALVNLMINQKQVRKVIINAMHNYLDSVHDYSDDDLVSDVKNTNQ